MDISRLRELAGIKPQKELKPIKEALGDELDLPRDDDETTDVGSDALSYASDEDLDDVEADDEDVDEVPGRAQSPEEAKRAAAAIAAMRKQPDEVPLEHPELGDDVGAEVASAEALPDVDDVAGEPGETTNPVDAAAASLEPDLATDVLAAPGPLGEPESQSTKKQRGEKSRLALDFLKDKPEVSRKEFMKFAETIGMGPAFASAFFFSPKAKAVRHAQKLSTVTEPDQAAAIAAAPMEFWVIKNQHGKTLAEDSYYDMPLWTSGFEGIFPPRVMTENEALHASEVLTKNGYKNTIEKVSLE